MAVAAAEFVVSVGADDEVGSLSSEEEVRAGVYFEFEEFEVVKLGGVGVEAVVASLPEDDVGSKTAEDAVVALAGADNVVASFGEDDVVSSESNDDVWAFGADDGVVVLGADDGCDVSVTGWPALGCCWACLLYTSDAADE